MTPQDYPVINDRLRQVEPPPSSLRGTLDERRSHPAWVVWLARIITLLAWAVVIKVIHTEVSSWVSR